MLSHGKSYSSDEQFDDDALQRVVTFIYFKIKKNIEKPLFQKNLTNN